LKRLATEKTEDYLKARQLVFSRCRQLEQEVEIDQRKGFEEKAAWKREHIVFLREMVDFFDKKDGNVCEVENERGE
jgi:hypothetical protein